MTTIEEQAARLEDETRAKKSDFADFKGNYLGA